MSEKITRAQLVDAAQDLNKVLDLSPSIDVKLGVSQLREQVVEAVSLMRTVKNDHGKVAAPTRAVLIALRGDVFAAVPDIRSSLEKQLAEEGKNEGEVARELTAMFGASESDTVAFVEDLMGALVELQAREPEQQATTAASEAAPAGKKRSRASEKSKGVGEGQKPDAKKKVKLGKFEPVRRGSGLFAKVLDAALGKDELIASVAADLDTTVDKVTSALRKARITNGIDHSVAEDGRLTIILPGKVTPETVWKKAAAEKSTKPNGSAHASKRKFSDEDIITVVSPKNPKKSGAASYDRFELYRSGMTVSQYKEAGGLQGDLSWDTTHGFIEVSRAAT